MSTGTYRFTTGYYSRTVETTKFQKLMNLTLVIKNSLFVYIDHILIVTKKPRLNIQMNWKGYESNSEAKYYWSRKMRVNSR